MFGVTAVLLSVSFPACIATVLDLTHTYGEDVLYPPVGWGMFNFTPIHHGYEPSLDNWLEINKFTVFEHGSTHIDAPAHYAEGRAHINEVPAEQLIGPGVMIDIQDKAVGHPDYLMTIEDIKQWEGINGDIPQGAIVMMNTGKHKLYPNRKLFYGTETPEDASTYHNPGLEPSAARWLMQNRQIKIFGTDAHSCDPGQNHNRNKCHVEFLPNGVLLLEFVANLDRMPKTGSTVFCGPIKMRNGSGGPTRIMAIYGDGGEAASHSPRLFGLEPVVLIACLLTGFLTLLPYHTNVSNLN